MNIGSFIAKAGCVEPWQQEAAYSLADGLTPRLITVLPSPVPFWTASEKSASPTTAYFALGQNMRRLQFASRDRRHPN